MVIISGDVEKPDKLNLPQEHSSNTNSDLYCIPPVSYKSYSWLHSPNMFSHRTAGKGHPWWLHESGEVRLCCDSLQTPSLQSHRSGFGSHCESITSCRPRVQPPIVNSVRRKRSALEDIRLVIKCSSTEDTYVISAHTYGPELYLKGGKEHKSPPMYSYTMSNIC